MIAPEDSLLFVTADGSTPGTGALPSSGLVDLDPLPGVSSVTLKAIAVNGFGLASSVSERRISLDSDPGSKPVLASSPGEVPGTALVTVSGGSAASYVFEISSNGSEPPAPSAGSPRLPLPLSLSVPFGVARSFRIACAAVDTAGRTLAVSDFLTVVLNRRPPPQPVLSPPAGSGPFDTPLTVAIKSPGTVYFSLTGDGTTPRDPTPESSRSSAALVFPGVEGEIHTYRLKVVAVDEAGNRSEVYGPFLYTLDLRDPKIPSLGGIAEKGRYNARRISPVLAESPWRVLYTVSTDGSAPPDPDIGSPSLTSETIFQGDEGSVTPFRLKLLAVSRSGKRLGERREISFSIDLKPPEIPPLSGIENGGRYAQPVTITAGPVADDVQVYYSVSATDTDPEDPVARGQLYTRPLTFDAAEGERRDVTLRIAARDGAGNRSLYDRRYRFSIDRELPDDPEVSGAPASGISGMPVTLVLKSAQGTIRYSLTEDGSMPLLPTDKSPICTSPLMMPGRWGVSVSYRLLARVFDELGNASRGGRIVTVTIDRTTPAVPTAPRIIYAPESSTVAFLDWDRPATGRLLYRLKNGTDAANDFIPFTQPVPVIVPGPDGTTISGEAIIENPAGTRGSAQPFRMSIGRRAPTPVLRGVRDGASYIGKVEIRAEAASGQVHYELSTDGNYPPAVTASSPVASAPLSLDAADGETVEVRVAARTFDPSGAALPSEETRLGFVIDRTPPDPPLATGIEDGGYYQDARRVTLLAAEGTIFYSVSSGAEPAMPAPADSNRYTGPLVLEAKSGQTVSYHILAFTLDSAGNRSREVKAWNVTIDQKIVYVSPRRQRLRGWRPRGSRAKPWSCLANRGGELTQDDIHGGGSIRGKGADGDSRRHFRGGRAGPPDLAAPGSGALVRDYRFRALENRDELARGGARQGGNQGYRASRHDGRAAQSHCPGRWRSHPGGGDPEPFERRHGPRASHERRQPRRHRLHVPRFRRTQRLAALRDRRNLVGHGLGADNG